MNTLHKLCVCQERRCRTCEGQTEPLTASSLAPAAASLQPWHQPHSHWHSRSPAGSHAGSTQHLQAAQPPASKAAAAPAAFCQLVCAPAIQVQQ